MKRMFLLATILVLPQVQWCTSGSPALEEMGDPATMSVDDVVRLRVGVTFNSDRNGTADRGEDIVAEGEGLVNPMILKTMSRAVAGCFLARNKIVQLSRATFGCPVGRMIDLEGNNIASIGQGTWALQRGLRRLSLQNNGIQQIGQSDFRGLSGIRVLNLSENRLTGIPAGTFDYLPRLGYLNLSNNQLTEIPADIFSKTTRNLREIILEDSPLSKEIIGIIAEYATEYDERRIVLDLDGNPLTKKAKKQLRQYKQFLAACGSKKRKLTATENKQSK